MASGVEPVEFLISGSGDVLSPATQSILIRVGLMKY